MISDKKFKQEEFVGLCKDFAQACANKKPGSQVTLKQDPLINGVIVTISYNGKHSYVSLTLTHDGSVKMETILGYV